MFRKKGSRKSSKTNERRQSRRKRSRAKLVGSSTCPRISVFRSNRAMYVQLIDDMSHSTVMAASTNSKANKGKIKNTIEGVKELGRQFAAKAIEKEIQQVKYDRSGYLYHGKVRALAEGLREAGMRF